MLNGTSSLLCKLIVVVFVIVVVTQNVLNIGIYNILEFCTYYRIIDYAPTFHTKIFFFFFFFFYITCSSSRYNNIKSAQFSK